MAKGKHAAALFEVIHSGKDRQQDKKGLLLTPKWWFKNRPKSQSLAGEPPTRQIDADEDEEPVAFVPIGVESRRSSRRMALPITYRNAALWAAGAVGVIAIGFVIGSKLRSGPAPANGESIEQLKRGQVNADVLRVGAGTNAANNPAGGTTSAPPGLPPPSQQVNAQDAGAKATGAGAAPIAPAFTGKRVVGLQYVVVQSYPKEADAKAAADLLTKNGVGCTIQQAFWPGRNDWFTVIGTTGFERTKNNPEYSKYLQTISHVSSEFAGKTRFRQFDPVLFTWKDPNH